MTTPSTPAMDAAPPATPAGPALTAAQLRSLLIVLCAGLALVVAGNSALAIALPDIAADLGADQSELTWIIDAYALTFAALLLTAGIAADRVGRRTILVIGLVIFGGASLASAFSPDPAWFIGLRALSGVGAAAVFPVTLSALVDAYPEERRTFADRLAKTEMRYLPPRREAPWSRSDEPEAATERLRRSDVAHNPSRAVR